MENFFRKNFYNFTLWREEIFLTYLDNFFKRIEKLVTYISAFALLMMMLLIVTDVVIRSVFNMSMTGTIEITGDYLLPIIVFLSISYTYTQGNHISVNIITEKLPKNIKMIVKLLTSSLSLLIIVILMGANFYKIFEFIESNTLTMSLLNYPLAPAIMIITFGLFLLMINLLSEVIFILREKFN